MMWGRDSNLATIGCRVQSKAGLRKAGQKTICTQMARSPEPGRRIRSKMILEMLAPCSKSAAKIYTRALQVVMAAMDIRLLAFSARRTLGSGFPEDPRTTVLQRCQEGDGPRGVPCVASVGGLWPESCVPFLQALMGQRMISWPRSLARGGQAAG